jgi:NAD(P)H dehydrogenase (quinone)
MPRVEDPDHPVGLAAQEYNAGEESLKQEADSWTIMRTAPYAELHVVERLPELFGSGQVVTNAADGRMPFISRADIAAAAAAILVDADQHAEQTYDVSGPDRVSWKEVAGLIEDLSGREIGYVEMDDDEYRKATEASGVPPLFVDALVGMGIAVREGYFDEQSDIVERVTGRPPADLRTVLSAHVAELQNSEQP